MPRAPEGNAALGPACARGWQPPREPNQPTTDPQTGTTPGAPLDSGELITGGKMSAEGSQLPFVRQEGQIRE